MSDFFRVDRDYLFHGYVHRIHCVIECAYGPVALATFVRRGMTDVQLLILPQFLEAQLLPLETECDSA